MLCIIAAGEDDRMDTLINNVTGVVIVSKL